MTTIMQFKSAENGIVFDVENPNTARLLQNPAKGGLVTKSTEKPASQPNKAPKGKNKATATEDDNEQVIS